MHFETAQFQILTVHPAKTVAGYHPLISHLWVASRTTL